MREPEHQAFTRSYWGGYFVRYPDGNISGLMSRAVALSYAEIFGGTVHLHSEVKARRKRAWRTARNVLVFAAGLCALLLVATAAEGSQGSPNGFKPLTRAEPIVRMVLQEAANEPVYGQIAVAGVALDRIKDRRWPNTAKGVIYQPAQFTGMNLKLRNYSETQITRARLSVEIARTGYRPCGRVLWYDMTSENPWWAKHYKKYCEIGKHTFYGE